MKFIAMKKTAMMFLVVMAICSLGLFVLYSNNTYDVKEALVKELSEKSVAFRRETIKPKKEYDLSTLSNKAIAGILQQKINDDLVTLLSSTFYAAGLRQEVDACFFIMNIPKNKVFARPGALIIQLSEAYYSSARRVDPSSSLFLDFMAIPMRYRDKILQLPPEELHKD